MITFRKLLSSGVMNRSKSVAEFMSSGTDMFRKMWFDRISLKVIDSWLSASIWMLKSPVIKVVLWRELVKDRRS